MPLFLRMVADASVCPIVVPFVHAGMEHILKVGDWIPLSVSQQLHVLVGDPIDFRPLIEEYKTAGRSQRYV